MKDQTKHTLLWVATITCTLLFMAASGARADVTKWLNCYTQGGKKYCAVDVIQPDKASEPHAIPMVVYVEVPNSKTPVKVQATPRSKPKHHRFIARKSYMKISARGLRKLKQIEGFKPNCYWDEKQWSIGYGTGVPRKLCRQTINEKKGHKLLVDHLNNKVENHIKHNVKVPLTQNQYDALAILCYNIQKPCVKSTLLKELNRGRYNSAANQFLVWNRVNNKKNPTIYRRRQKERRLFLASN